MSLKKFFLIIFLAYIIIGQILQAIIFPLSTLSFIFSPAGGLEGIDSIIYFGTIWYFSLWGLSKLLKIDVKKLDDEVRDEIDTVK